MKRVVAGIRSGRWHTISVTPGPNLPKIHFYDKLNPLWWLQNADEPVPPAWYRPKDAHRVMKWHFRNPFHNFDHYVIGVADKQFYRSGRFPRRDSSPHGGWNFAIVRRGTLALLPFTDRSVGCQTSKSVKCLISLIKSISKCSLCHRLVSKP